MHFFHEHISLQLWNWSQIFCFHILCFFPPIFLWFCVFGGGGGGVGGGKDILWIWLFPHDQWMHTSSHSATHYLKLTLLLQLLSLWCVSRTSLPLPVCFSFTTLQNLGFLCCCPTVWCRTDTYTKILAGTKVSCSRNQSSSSVPQLTSLPQNIWSY